MAARKRKSLKPSVRFEVFKRDKFTCQYCGTAAPQVVLRVDHIHPVAKGGQDDLLNLITSCFDCNAGKGAKTLSDDSAIVKQRTQLEELQERREQLDMLVQWKTGLASIDDDAVEKIHGFYKQQFIGWTLNEKGIATLRSTIQKHGAADVMDAIAAAARQYLKFDDKGHATAHSVDHAWSYVPRILSVRRADKRTPGMDDLFYARGIARKRCAYFNDWKALEILKEAHSLGADPGNLRSIAAQCTSWTSWCLTMDDLIARLRGEEA